MRIDASLRAIAIALSLIAAQTMNAGAQDVSFALATAKRFHELLAAGDSAGAVRLLAPDLVVVEAGYIETRAEYLAHHLGADMEFAKGVPARREVISAKREGDVAWIVSSSAASGKMHDRQIDSRGAELIVLSRSNGAWLIRSVHWSSQRRP
jgi:ketosteroid isomerase-like protein